MDLVKELLRDASKAQVVRIADYIGKDSERFKELISLFMKGEVRVTQRASHVISECAEREPWLVKGYVKKMVGKLNEPVHDAVKRNILRILQWAELPESVKGNLADQCFSILSSNKEAIAIQAFALTVLHRIAQEAPELMRELRLLVQDKYPYTSAAFRSRARQHFPDLKNLD